MHTVWFQQVSVCIRHCYSEVHVMTCLHLFVYVCLHMTYLMQKSGSATLWRLLNVHEDQESSKQMINHKHIHHPHTHTGKGNPCSGVQCTGGQVPSDSVW